MIQSSIITTASKAVQFMRIGRELNISDEVLIDALKCATLTSVDGINLLDSVVSWFTNDQVRQEHGR